jgi:hypothetical protein
MLHHSHPASYHSIALPEGIFKPLESIASIPDKLGTFYASTPSFGAIC